MTTHPTVIHNLLLGSTKMKRHCRASTHGVMGRQIDPSFQPVLHDWCIKGHGMYYPVCGMVQVSSFTVLSGPLPYV